MKDNCFTALCWIYQTSTWISHRFLPMSPPPEHQHQLLLSNIWQHALYCSQGKSKFRYWWNPLPTTVGFSGIWHAQENMVLTHPSSLTFIQIRQGSLISKRKASVYMIGEAYPLLQVWFNLLIKFCICVSSSVVSGAQVLRQAPKTSSSLCREERNTTYWGSGLCIPSTLWLPLVAQSVKSLPATWETWVQSLGREDPLEKEMAPAPVFLPGECHGQRNLVGYSPWGHKESDMTEYFHFHLIF